VHISVITSFSIKTFNSLPLAMASDEIVRNLVSREEVMGNLISTASSSVRSPLHDTLCSHVRTVIDSVEKKAANRKHIDVRRNISSEELQMLLNAYPEYAITSSACENGTHSMAACFRFLETEYLLDMVPQRDTFVYDIGGNWFSHMKFRADRDIHCCCPILSLRDSERLETRMMSMQRYMRGPKEKPLRLLRRYQKILHEQAARKAAFLNNTVDAEALNGEVFCENTFQECVVKVPEGFLRTAVAVHSIYDIKVEEFVAALKRKGITQAFGCFLFPPAVLVGQKEGILPSVNGHYRVEKGKIKFFFANDPNAGYTHDLKDYLKYLEKTYIEIEDGVFSIELIQQRGDTMFFKVTDVTTAVYHMKYRGMAFDETFKCIPMLKNSSVVVPLFSWNRSKISVISGLLPRTLVEQGAAFIMKNKDKDLNVAVLKNYLSSVNNSYIFNGSQVRDGVKVAPDLLSKLAVTLYLRELVWRKREKAIIGHFEETMLKDPTLKDLFNGFLWFVPNAIGGVWKNARKALLDWFGYTEFDESSFDICDPVLYVEIEDRYKIIQRGNLPLGEYFDCEEECKQFEQKEKDKQDLASQIVDKAVGVVKSENDGLENLIQPVKQILAQLIVPNVISAVKKPRAPSSLSEFSSLPGLSPSTSHTSETPQIDFKVSSMPGSVPTWEVACKSELVFQRINEDMSRRTQMPMKPKVTSSYAMNARAEFLYYQLCSVISERAQILSVIEDFRQNMIYSDKVAVPLNARIFSYKTETPSWLFKVPGKSEVGHSYAVHFDFKAVGIDLEDSLEYCRLVPISWDRSDKFISTTPFFPEKTGYYIICDNTKLCNNWLIYNNLVDVYEKVIDRPIRFELIDGVPGCGKSTMILNSCDLRREVVIGEGRNATDDLRERFKKRKHISPKVANHRVRTLDSVLLAEGPCVPKADKFHFDEALKVHYGAIMFCADKLGAKEVLAQGDRAQLPMICRVEGIELEYQSPDYSHTVITPKLQSFRIPGDVAFYLSAKGFYKVDGVPQTVTTKNKVERSMFARGETTLNRFVSLLDVPVRKDTHYLTFLQAEKENLISHLVPKGVKRESISTIHEAQGGTYENVILVRLQRTANEIYPGGLRSKPYIVVGTSRHTKTFTYCSVVDDKLLLDIEDDGGLSSTPVRIFKSHLFFRLQELKI